MKQLIIVVASRNKEFSNLNAFYVFEEYINALKYFQAHSIVAVPGSKNYEYLANLCDGLLLCGGSDVNAHFYNEIAHSTSKPANNDIDLMDIKLLEAFQKVNKPIFGICRGMQLINISLGGTLTQDIPSQLMLSEVHNQITPRHQTTHSIHLKKDSTIESILGTSYMVNSFHHQCISTLGNGLCATGFSDDHIIEVIEGPSILGIQWHPESMNDKESKQLFEHFINQCHKRRKHNV